MHTNLARMFEKKERVRKFARKCRRRALKSVALGKKIRRKKKYLLKNKKRGFKILIKLNFSHSFHFGLIWVSIDPLKLSIGPVCAFVESH